MNDNRLQEINDFLQNLVQKQKETIDKQEAEIERLTNKLDTVKQKVIETIPFVEDDIKTAKAEAYKEFAERLCEDRVSNDPVVIAVKTELKFIGE